MQWKSDVIFITLISRDSSEGFDAGNLANFLTVLLIAGAVIFIGVGMFAAIQNLYRWALSFSDDRSDDQ